MWHIITFHIHDMAYHAKAGHYKALPRIQTLARPAALLDNLLVSTLQEGAWG
jgi:hypothetical protein